MKKRTKIILISVGVFLILVIAGGLSHKNIMEAVAAALPDAVDISSGVESAPGIKNLEKVRHFIEAVSQCECGNKKFRKIYSMT